MFRCNEFRREFSIEPAVNEFALMPFERKEKGVVTYFVAQNDKPKPLSAAQLWTLVPAK